MSPSAAGWWAAVPTTVGIFGSLLVPRFATAERRLPILLGLFVAALAASLLLHAAPGPLLGLGMILQGIARGSMTTLAVLILVETSGVGSRNAAAASGLFFAAAEIGGVAGPFTIGLLHDASGGFDLPLGTVTAVVLGLILGGMLLRRRGG